MRIEFFLFVNIFTVLIKGETAVLILARGGSKGIRLKNLQTVGGLSLVTRAIHTARAAGLNDVTVSTDHPLIALESIKKNLSGGGFPGRTIDLAWSYYLCENVCFSLGRSGGAEVFQRSPITATDWAPSIWGAAEFLASRLNVEVLVLIQATSPFLKPNHLNGALQKLRDPKQFDCIFSVTRSYKLRWRLEDKGVVPINFDISARPRRQDWDGELLEAGAFYISRRNIVLDGCFQNSNCTVWEVSAAESFEVDSVHDLQVANALLNLT